MRMLLSVVCLIALLFAAGCGKNAITVDGEAVSKELFEHTLKERIDAHKAMNLKVDEKAVRKSVADELVAEAILIKEARNRKITVPDDELQKTVAAMRAGKSEQEFIDGLKKSGITYNLYLSRVKNRMILTRLMSDLVKDDSVTEEQLREFYTKSQVPLLKPEKVFVKILQLNAEADAKAATERLKKKEDFDKVSADLVKSGKASATDYGWLQPDTVSKEMGTAMKTAKLNLVQGPYKAKDGSYYFFRVKERQASQPVPFEEAKDQIKATLLNQRRQEAALQIVESVKKKAKIQYKVPV